MRFKHTNRLGFWFGLIDFCRSVIRHAGRGYCILDYLSQ